MTKLQCPKCKKENTKVYSVRQKEDRITRYRKCLDCGHKFKTIEQIPSDWSSDSAIKQIKKIVGKF